MDDAPQRPEIIEDMSVEEIRIAAERGYRPIYLKDGALADFQKQVRMFIDAVDTTIGPSARGQLAIAKTKADEMIYWLSRAQE